MPPSIQIPTNEIIRCYQKIRQLLDGNDLIVFNAVTAVADQMNFPFKMPSSVGEYQDRHSVIEKRMKQKIFNGNEFGLSLIAEIACKIKDDKPKGLIFDSFLDHTNMSVNNELELFLTPSMVWSVRWKNTNIVLGVWERGGSEVVPSYVFEYINNAIVSHQNGLNFVAAAMMSIVVEATLRDMLIAQGFSYIPRASSVDVYKTIKAQVTSDNTNFIISFPHSMPRTASDYLTAVHGQPCDIEIRRIIKEKKNGDQRIDLVIIDPVPLVDFWSTAEVEQLAQRSIGGLGAALKIARQEGILTDMDLPEDFDTLITIIRNNLIHLSGEALATKLPRYAPPRNTLNGFLKDNDMVLELIDYVSQFVNQKYLMLKLGIT